MPVVFDIGGVIFEDVWESIFLTPKSGIVDLLDLDKNYVTNHYIELWKKYSILNTTNSSWEAVEIEYWSDVLKALKLPWSIDQCIEYSENFLTPIIGVDKLINLLVDNSIQIGICSNQTAFWFERQLAISRGLSRIDRNNMILSFEQGETKDNLHHNLFNKVANKMQSTRDKIMYIEDRKKHYISAKKFGFESILFNRNNPDMLSKLEAYLIIHGITLDK